MDHPFSAFDFQKKNPKPTLQPFKKDIYYI